MISIPQKLGINLEEIYKLTKIAFYKHMLYNLTEVKL